MQPIWIIYEISFYFQTSDRKSHKIKMEKNMKKIPTKVFIRALLAQYSYQNSYILERYLSEF